VVACALVCLASLAVVGASGGAAGSDHVTVEAATDEEDRGDLLRFAVSLPDGDNATLAVEGPEYSRRVRVTDASGDGEVSLRVNTYLANRSTPSNEVYAAAGEDTVTVRGGNDTGDNRGERFGLGTYTVAPEGDAGERSASVTVTAPGPWNATAFVAPAGRADRLTDRAAIERARAAGWLTRSEEVALNDTLVLRVNASGVGGALAAESGPNETSRFFAVQERPGTALYAINKHLGPEEPFTILRLNETRSTAVVATPRADTYYIVVATDAVRAVSAESRYGRVPHSRLREQVFVPRFVFGGEYRLNGEDFTEPNGSGEFVLLEREATPIQRHVDPIVVAARGNATVGGTTTLAPGSRVTVRLTRGPDNRTVASDTVRVSQERRDPAGDGYDPPGYAFRATFDLRNATPGGVDVSVTANETALGTAQGELVGGVAAVELAGRDTQSPNQVRVANATLPAGGFLVVEADGRFLASTDRLDPGTHENVSVPLGDLDAEKFDGATTLRAFAARDTNGDGRYNVQYDRPYLDGPIVVNDTLALDPATPTGTPGTGGETATTDGESGTTQSGVPATATTAGTGSGGTSAGTAPAETAGGRNPTATTTRGDGPGFGVTAVLLALAVAALGAGVRRR
jgi:hypothetical protein